MINIELKKIAKKLNKTISEIARETGINRNTITSLYHNKVDGIKFSTLEKLCNTYNLKISNLIKYKPKKDNTEDEIYKQEAEMATFISSAIAPIFNNLNPKYFKFGLGKIKYYTKNGYMIGYLSKNNLDDLAKYVFENYSEKNNFKKLYTDYLRKAKELQSFYFEYSEEDITSFGEIEFKNFLQILIKKYQNFWKMCLFIDGFDAGFDQIKIKEIADKYQIDKKDIGILTTPDKMTFNNEKLLALLEIIKNIKQQNIKKNNLSKFLKNYIINSPLILSYKRNFDYYKTNYLHLDHITDDEVKNEIIKYYSDKKLFQKTYHNLINYSSIQKKIKDKILKKYKLKENPLLFFSELTYWREHRKQTNLMGNQLFFYSLKALENLSGLNFKILKNLNIDEVDNLLKGFVNKTTLINRDKEGTIEIIDENGYKMIEGKEAESIKNEEEKRMLKQTTRDIIQGHTASQGYAKGIAKIISDKNSFNKFKEGDILITSMTRPEFVPLMKKAAGIVTDEGGITCHAAIISRELEKPCIIGTQTATQIIKDSDLIEVRANHGTVRILNR